MTGCKIGKIRMKNGGAEIRALPQSRTHFHNSVENMGASISDDTHAVGFFVLYDDGQLTSGISYNSGFTASQLKGACEHMKDCLMADVWGEDE